MMFGFMEASIFRTQGAPSKSVNEAENLKNCVGGGRNQA